MKRYLTLYRSLSLFFILLLLAGSSYAQGEYNNWHFGVYAGISFNTSPPSAFTNSKLRALESSSSISDKDGNILFYTDGDTVWNRNNVVMKNGVVSLIYRSHENAVQGSMVLPVPGSSNLYYIILGNAHGPGNRDSDTSVGYAIVDISADGGLGEVIQKKKKLFHSQGECFAVTAHGNATDYWVAGVDIMQNRYWAVRTTAGQFITPPMNQPVFDIAADPLTGNNFFNNKFSPDSKIFASNLTERVVTGNKKQRYLQLYRFDNNTGTIYSKISIDIGYDTTLLAYAYEFSPDSRFLYMNILSGSKRRIVQYDVSAWNEAVVNASAVTVFEDGLGTPFLFYKSMQLGPDGRIYMFYFSNSVSVIENPDVKGIACGVVLDAVNFAGRNNSFGGPYYPSFLMKYRLDLGKDTTLCVGDSLRLNTKAPVSASILWSTGATTPFIDVNKPGIYSVAVILPTTTLYDTIEVQVGDKFKVYLGSDTAFCSLFSHLLNAGAGAKSYQWSTGETSMQITVNQFGTYAVKVLDSNACPAGDTIRLDEIKRPVVKIQYDSISCKYAYLAVVGRQAEVDYLWSTGDTGILTKVQQKGLYKVTASNKFCSSTDSIKIDLLPQPVADLGPDVFYCDKPVMLEVNDAGVYRWNTGAVSKSIMVTEPGIYTVSVSRNACIAYDTVEVKTCEDMSWYIPNAFSPDGNAFNPVFKVYGSNIGALNMQIYNRWGEKLYEGNGIDAAWSGDYMQQACQEGIYMYTVELEGYKRGVWVKEHARGIVTLFR